MSRSRKAPPRSNRGPRRRGPPPRRAAERTAPPSRAAGSRGTDTDEPPVQGPVVHVAFRGCRCEAYLNSAEVVLRRGDHVLVEAERGQDLGRVIVPDGADLRRRRRQPLRQVVRQALPEEIARLATLVQQDREALEVCQSRARHFNLEMRVIDAETQFDGNRITFYFTAEQRVDFRELVRDLASIFRTRIELRQVGARDAARRCDGVGPCGRRLCCTTFLREFEPVTLKMAKDQSLPLNPAKISGSCGRLMCCLNYEAAGYHAAMRSAPVVGSRWSFQGKEWRVERCDPGNNRVLLEDADGAQEQADLTRFQAEAEALPAQSPAAPEGSPPSGQDPGEPRPPEAEGIRPREDPPGQESVSRPEDLAGGSSPDAHPAGPVG